MEGNLKMTRGRKIFCNMCLILSIVCFIVSLLSGTSYGIYCKIMIVADVGLLIGVNKIK